MTRRSIDSRIDFLSSISLVPGLGPSRVAAFKEAGIGTIGDLLYHFPRRYIDRSHIVPLDQLERYKDRECSVIGTVVRTRLEPGRHQRLRIQVSDATGSMEALWFQGVQFFRKSIHTGIRVLLTGKVTFYGRIQMVHPQIETMPEGKDHPDILFLPVYPIPQSIRDSGVQQKMYTKCVLWALRNCHHFPMVIPESILRRRQFPSLEESLNELHTPSDLHNLERYSFRMRYEELYKLALTLRWSRRKFSLPGRSLDPGDLADRFRAVLPFRLTDDQEKAVRVLLDDAASGRRMHRLLQGDVGSGKTVAAFMSCLPALHSGHQVAWLTPTEVLARQSYLQITSWLGSLGFEASLLKGGMGVSERAAVLQGLESGKIRFVVGTHALLMPGVKFKSLGMIVIDEQHKFGAQQRLAIQEKDVASDFLLMSATPIPQTLAQTLYGDLDVVTIAHPPAGRQAVSTHIVPEHKRTEMEKFVLSEIQEHGAQVFYVVPRIEGGDEEEEDTLRTAESVYRRLSTGTFARITSGCIHGKLGSDKKEMLMQDFAAGKIKLLVATTVIEVGIDVPAATIMIIENAERFGLAQLHQLRGRVGRGSVKSWCLLLPGSELDSDTMQRLESFRKNHDGFRIAELDLQFRGPGEVAGYRQSGWDDLKLADILRDASLFREIQEEIDSILSELHT
jgi:ATP-dependent DNA helicase RecG